MLHVQNQRKIQDRRLQFCIFLIRPEHPQDVFRSGKLFGRIMNIKALSLYVMIVCLIAVHRQHREHGDQRHTLTQDIGETGVIRMSVISIQRQNTS